MLNPWMPPKEQSLKVQRDNYAVDTYQVHVLLETEADLQRSIDRLASSNFCPPMHDDLAQMLDRVRGVRESLQQRIEESIARTEEILVIEQLERGESNCKEISQETDVSVARVEEIVQKNQMS